MRLQHILPLAPLALALGACGGGPTPPAVAPSPVSSAPVGKNELPPGRPLPTFENPGGMWMPHQIKGAHEAKLRELGLAIDPAELSDPASGLLQAVVSLGGCSASFISSDGLIATNHHCATGALQHNSNPSANLLKDGFVAKTRAEEKNNGPQARVFVTRAVTDVSAKVREGLDKIEGDRARYKEIEKRTKEITAACEKGHAELRCSTASFYEGESYYLIEQLEIRDVRLVWAPPAGVGNYGGEIDNWRWPRHTGDVSFFRAYVGKDGSPAVYAPDNVPFKPKHHLKVAQNGLREGDLVMVAGYPGRTATLKTKAEVDEAVGWGYPRRVKMLEAYLARLSEVTKDDKEAQIRSTSYVRRFNNALTNTKGQIEGLEKGGLAKAKAQKEAELAAWIETERKGKAGGPQVLEDIAKAVEANAKTREKDAALEELALPRLVTAAIAIVRMAEERPKKDAERDPDYQERNWPRQEQALAGMTTSFHTKVDQGLLVLAIERSMSLGGFTTKMLVGKDIAKAQRADVENEVAKLYAETKLGDEKTRVDLLKTATTAQLKVSKDPLVQLALRLRPIQKEAEERREQLAGRMATLKPRYIAALRAFAKDAPIAPDANSTLRITYGTVRGYRATPSAPMQRPFTLLREVVAKHKGQEPFDVPKRLLDAEAAGKVGPYVDPSLGDVPVDFLADLHITGGNSGSATLNAKGELTGLVFDGNYEAMASDWVFVPAITRSIHVDIRYVLWLLDAVDGGDHLLEEIGVAPKL